LSFNDAKLTLLLNFHVIKPPLATVTAASCNGPVHLFVCLSVCLCVCLSVYLSVSPSVAKMQKRNFLKN